MKSYVGGLITGLLLAAGLSWAQSWTQQSADDALLRQQLQNEFSYQHMQPYLQEQQHRTTEAYDRLFRSPC